MRDRYSDSEWLELQSTPMCVYLLVASADGKISKLAPIALERVLDQYPGELAAREWPRDQLFHQMITDLNSHRVEVLSKVVSRTQNGEKCLGILHSAHKLLQRSSDEMAYAFKGHLLTIGLAIAKKSKWLKREPTGREFDLLNETALALGIPSDGSR